LFQIIDKGIAVRDQLIKGEVISHEWIRVDKKAS
jgi:hypothetical protein